MNKPIPKFLDVVKTYRKERGLSFKEAMREAKRQFEARGWPILESMKGLCK